MRWIKNCDCNRGEFDSSKTIEFFKISESRTELRCSRCKGLMGWWDEPSKAKKIVPVKREWSYEERLSLK
ncbi:MAG TPA: hypothetical protein VD815_09435 [Candidatus Saccharimonadales bacterium]|nr:hypothetical protein [Candidatus Saccharimonadales bacterium]